jgi:AcrR family transcriptional regulator
MAPKERKAEILQAALKVAAICGLTTFTRAQVADEAGISPASVNKYFTTMAQLRRDVMRAAVRDECLKLIAQGIVLGDKQALKAPAELRARALASVR